MSTTDTTEITQRAWLRYARHIEWLTRERTGSSPSCLDIACGARHMIVTSYPDGRLVVRRGWGRVMRHVARTLGAAPSPRPAPGLHARAPLGPRIRLARERIGMTQAALARAIGLSRRESLARVEEGHQSNPGIVWMINIAQICGVSLDWLCGLTEEEPSCEC